MMSGLMRGLRIRDIFSQVRIYCEGYYELARNCVNNYPITEKRAQKKADAPEKEPHNTPFIAVEIDKNIEYAAQHNSPLNCVLVRFRDERAIDEIFALLKEGFHGNNGCYPSNELRKIGNFEMGVLAHNNEASVYGTLVGIMEYVNCLNPKNIAFAAGVGSYKKGDQRWDLIQKAQKSIFNFNDDEKLALNLEKIIAKQPKPNADDTKEAVAILQKNYDARTKEVEALKKQYSGTAA